MENFDSPTVLSGGGRILIFPAAFHAESVERLAEKIDIEALRTQSSLVKTSIFEDLTELENELRAIVSLATQDMAECAEALIEVSQVVRKAKAVIDQLAPTHLP